MPTPLQTAARRLLGLTLLATGTGHLTFARIGFRAQVPDAAVELTPFSRDEIVADSGYVELALGAATLLAGKRLRAPLGWGLAAFFAAVYPGNIAQFIHRRDGLGLDTDTRRLVRLFGQPVLIAWALWSTGAAGALRERLRSQSPKGSAEPEQALSLGEAPMAPAEPEGGNGWDKMGGPSPSGIEAEWASDFDPGQV